MATEMGKETEKTITIEKYYNSETSKIKDDVTENLTKLEGIVVSVDKYSEYKFLIGKERKIVGVLEGEITDTTKMGDFTDIEEFEKDIFGSNVDPTDNMEINTDIKIILEKDVLSEEDVKINNYEFATIKASIEPIDIIDKITVNGKEVELDDTGSISIDVTENRTYKIIAYGKNETYNYAIVKVKDLSEDLDIYTKEELVQFEKNVNNGRTYKGKTVRLKRNIDLKDIDWKPIGYSISVEEVFSEFKGTFDGENHTISNMTIDSRNHEEVGNGIGFIGVIDESVVRNIIFNNPYIYSEKDYTSVVVASSGKGENLIENIKVLNGEVNSKADFVGGITGSGYAAIKNCYNNCTISSTSNYVGGICGCKDDKNIQNSYNSGNITGNSSVGGIIGFNIGGAVQDCYNNGTVTGKGKDQWGLARVGGVVGQNNGNILNCYNVKDVSSQYKNVGGITGHNSGKCENVYNIGTITKGSIIASAEIGSKSNYVGTLLGQNIGKFEGNHANTTIEDMKEWDSDTILQNLGENFKKNTNANINHGLPILKWQ